MELPKYVSFVSVCYVKRNELYKESLPLPVLSHLVQSKDDTLPRLSEDKMALVKLDHNK